MRDGFAPSTFVPRCLGALTWTSQDTVRSEQVSGPPGARAAGWEGSPSSALPEIRVGAGKGIAVARQVSWVVPQRVTQVRPIDGYDRVRIEAEKIGRHVCDNVQIVDDAIARACTRRGVNHIAVGRVAHPGTAKRD